MFPVDYLGTETSGVFRDPCFLSLKLREFWFRSPGSFVGIMYPPEITERLLLLNFKHGCLLVISDSLYQEISRLGKKSPGR